MYEAVNDFILQYTDVVQDNLYRSYQNRSTLPQTNDYTMFYEMSENRIGTNVDEIRDKETEIKSLREYTMNIDFCGDNQESLMQRAKNLAIIGRSNFGCFCHFYFFAEHCLAKHVRTVLTLKSENFFSDTLETPGFNLFFKYRFELFKDI